jgi:hypothetical protein
MDTLIWDITKSAPVHATLAGVLATLAIAVLAIISSIGGGPAPESGGHRASPGVEPNGQGVSAFARSIAIRSRPHVIRLLILAMLLLLVSAVIWGGLAGQPSVETLNSVLQAQSMDEPGRSQAISSSVHAVKVRESVAGSAAVTVLAVGGLSFVAGILELASTAPAQFRSRLETFTGRAFSILAALSIYEATYFAVIAVSLYGESSIGPQTTSL